MLCLAYVYHMMFSFFRPTGDTNTYSTRVPCYVQKDRIIRDELHEELYWRSRIRISV